MLYLSKCCCKSVRWFFCICRNCLELFLQLSSTASTPTQCLSGWFSTSRERANFFCTFNLKEIHFLLSFHFLANFSKASMKDDTKSRRLGPQSEMGSCIKLDGIDIENGMCLPTHNVVSVSFKSSSFTQVDSKSKTAMLKFLVVRIRDKSSLSNRVSRSWYTFFGFTYSTPLLQVVRWRSNSGALLKKVSHVGQQ